MATPTKLGLELLTAILRSQYQQGGGRAGVVGFPIYTWDACEPFGRKAGGIVARLKSAGLVETDDSDADRDERTIWLTAAGYDALVDAALASAPA